MDARHGTAAEARMRIRLGQWTGPTAGLVPGAVQANLAVVPAAQAEDFERFCHANPQALPLLEITELGSPIPVRTAPTADLRTDLPRYRVYRYGDLNEERTEVIDLWTDDLVAFLIGCSFSFDGVLARHRIALRHVGCGRNVPMYRTSRGAVPAGVFAGPLVVSMRPVPRSDVDRVTELTRDLRIRLDEQPKTETSPMLEPRWLEHAAHGPPLWIGSPEGLGIHDLQHPDYGDPVPIHPDDVPVFWACGVTAQAAAQRSGIPLMIAHAPGHMFLTDLRVEIMGIA